MSDIEKINEELRNFKLFKIQRLNTKQLEFIELKDDLNNIQKNEYFNLLIGIFNIISIIFLIYNIYKSYNYDIGLKININLIINLSLTIFLSIYLTYKFIDYNFKLKKYIKTSENTITYFSNESDILKSNYENYVDNYLENLKKTRK